MPFAKRAKATPTYFRALPGALESMRTIAARPISQEEASVLKQAVSRAALGPVSDAVILKIDSLLVTGECECGCRSVQFECLSGEERMIADGVGYLQSGTRVDIIVWACGEEITLLEIVDHQGERNLPIPNTICSWEEAGRNAF